MRPAAIVINSTLARDLGRFRRRCREAAAAGGWEPSFLETTLDDRGVGLAGAAPARRAPGGGAAGGGGPRPGRAAAPRRPPRPPAPPPPGPGHHPGPGAG